MSNVELGGFDVAIPGIYPAVYTQMYDPTTMGVLTCPSPVDATEWYSLNRTTSQRPIKIVVSDPSKEQIAHPDTGRLGTYVSVSGARRAIRWYFADPNDDGTGVWYASPNEGLEERIQSAITGFAYKTVVVATPSNGKFADYVCPGFGDDRVLQEAIDHVSSVGGGVVKLKVGSYDVQSPILMKANVRLQGMGWGTQLRLGGAVADNVIECTSVDNWQITDLRVNGNRDDNPNSDYIGIEIDSCNYASVARVIVHGCNRTGTTESQGAGSGATTGEGINATNSKAISILDCEVYDNQGVGIKLTNVGGACEDCSIVGCKAHENGSDGILAWRCLHSTIAECQAYDGLTDGISLHGKETDGDGTTGPQYSTIVNCQAHDNAEDGIVLCTAPLACVVTGCTSYQNGNDGYNIFYNGNQNTIMGCTAELNGERGIHIQGKSDDTNGSSYNTVVGNTLFNNSQSSSGTYAGIRVSYTSSYNVINGNVCFGSDHDYGVDIAQASCTGNIVTSNMLRGNGTGGFNDSGTSTTSANNVTA